MGGDTSGRISIMSVFEFYTVLLSFVVSLGVASLLGSIVRLFQEADRVRFSLPHALWAVAIFNLQITFWLKSWTYRDQFDLRVSTALPPLVLAIIAFFACGLVTPHIPEDGTVDLQEFHARQGRKYQLTAALFMFAAIAQAALMDGFFTTAGMVTDSVVQFALAALAIAAALASRSRWLQVVVPTIWVIGGLVYFPQLMAL